MIDDTSAPKIDERPMLIIVLGWYAVLGCVIFAASILIVDILVPDHDWIADAISDLATGKYEFIVDIGIYAFSASFIAMSLLGAHSHMGGWKWSLRIVGLAFLGLIVFLIGARNEYGDNDGEGVVIYICFVYVFGLLMAAVQLMMWNGARRVGKSYGRMLILISAVWAVSAPIFFFYARRYGWHLCDTSVQGLRRSTLRRQGVLNII